jgi:hypothetical protein
MFYDVRQKSGNGLEVNVKTLHNIFDEHPHLLQNRDTLELSAFISQTKTDEIELIKSIGKTVETFAVLWINQNITNEEFFGSMENILNMKKLQFYRFSDSNKARINTTLEKLNDIIIQKRKVL